MKGIILAGGAGSRLFPITSVVSKQLLPVYNKPMIYYPLSVLMLAGIKEILIITTPADQTLFQSLLGDGRKWGLSLKYAQQERPEGLPQAFLIGRDFIAGNPCALILGDNLFFGFGLSEMLQGASRQKKGATVFCQHVHDPERYGVMEISNDGRPISLEEKPKNPRSNWAVTGLYFFDENVVEVASGLKPSARNELEIVDVLKWYLGEGILHPQRLGRGYAWFDAGTHESLLDASSFVRTIEARQHLKIACLEEIAWRMKFISLDMFHELSTMAPSNEYGQYLRDIAANPTRFT